MIRSPLIIGLYHFRLLSVILIFCCATCCLVSPNPFHAIILSHPFESHDFVMTAFWNGIIMMIIYRKKRWKWARNLLGCEFWPMRLLTHLPCSPNARRTWLIRPCLCFLLLSSSEFYVQQDDIFFYWLHYMRIRNCWDILENVTFIRKTLFWTISQRFLILMEYSLYHLVRYKILN